MSETMKRNRSHDFDWDEFPVIGGLGTVHDLNSDEQEPRLWFAKSVSRSAAVALTKTAPSARHPIGFRTKA